MLFALSLFFLPFYFSICFVWLSSISPRLLLVGPGADWFADGGHEPITDDEPDQEFDESHAGVLDTVVSTAPQWPSHPEF